MPECILYKERILQKEEAHLLEKRARFSLGVRIYVRKVVLFHLPKVRITESSIPALAAAVATPMKTVTHKVLVRKAYGLESLAKVGDKCLLAQWLTVCKPKKWPL